MTALALRSLSRERVLVERPGSERRRVTQSLVWFFVVLVAFNLWAWTGGWVHGVIGTLVGAYLGFSALSGMARARAYRNGWLDGRRAMVGSMAEAQRRGLSMYEWAEREAERDAATLGLRWSTLSQYDEEEDA